MKNQIIVGFLLFSLTGMAKVVSCKNPYFGTLHATVGNTSNGKPVPVKFVASDRAMLMPELGIPGSITRFEYGGELYCDGDSTGPLFSCIGGGQNGGFVNVTEPEGQVTTQKVAFIQITPQIVTIVGNQQTLNFQIRLDTAGGKLFVIDQLSIDLADCQTTL